MTSLEHSPLNDTRHRDFMRDVREFGRDAALGGDALPKFAIRLVKAAAEGVINPFDPKVHSQDNPDDAAQAYEAYVTAESGKAIHNHSKAGIKSNTSKARALIALGHNPNCDGERVVDRALAIRKEMMDAEIASKSAYPALVDVARAQNATDHELTDDEIKAAVTPNQALEPDLEKVWSDIHKKVEGLITGENKHGLKDTSEEAVAIEEKIREILNSFQQKQQLAALMEQATALGLIVSAPAPVEAEAA